MLMESAMRRLSLSLLGSLVLAGGGAGLLLAAPAPPVTAPDAPRRIVSLNLCADQLVLALADRAQIAGLTRNAANADMSSEAARARGLRILSSSAEEILEIEPDLIIGMPMYRSASTGVLRDMGYRTIDFRAADTLADIHGSIRTIAAAVGHPERGEALIATMAEQLAATSKPGRGRVAAYYQRRGFMTGTGTLVDDLMQRVGLVNLAGRLGRPALSQLSIEELVAARPDFLIVDGATDRVIDQGSEMLHHPALRDIPRIRVPQAWTVCGGPSYAPAAQSMARQIAAIDAGHR